MLYVYTVFIPLLIVLVIQRSSRHSYRSITGVVGILFKALPYLYGYGFLLYYLEIEEFISAGWNTYSFFFFLIPGTLIILLLKAYFHFREKEESN
jgi:hypothetical protein